MEAEAVGWPAGASRPDSTCRLPDLWSTSSFIMCTASKTGLAARRRPTGATRQLRIRLRLGLASGSGAAVAMSSLRRVTGVITLFLGVLAPLAAQDRTPPVSADSVLPLPELRVEVVRLRTGSVPIADVPFPVQIIAGSNFQGATGSSVADALTG